MIHTYTIVQYINLKILNYFVNYKVDIFIPMSSKFMFLFEIKVLEKQLFHSFEFYNCLAPLCSGLARGDGTFAQFDLNIYTIYLHQNLLEA